MSKQKAKQHHNCSRGFRPVVGVMNLPFQGCARIARAAAALVFHLHIYYISLYYYFYYILKDFYSKSFTQILKLKRMRECTVAKVIRKANLYKCQNILSKNCGHNIGQKGSCWMSSSTDLVIMKSLTKRVNMKSR